MEKKIVNFRRLAEIGSGYVQLDDESVSIVTEGINGSLKAWLTGGQPQQIGNLVGGKISRKIATENHSGVLITQSGKQMLYAHYGEEQAKMLEEDKEREFEYGSFKWKKVTERAFPAENSAVKYILSNESIYDCFLKNGYYWFGEKDGDFALAFPSENVQENPLWFIATKPVYENGHFIICIDVKNNALKGMEE